MDSSKIYNQMIIYLIFGIGADYDKIDANTIWDY